jgi:GNAT superfamily N-acetyltransferase
VTAIEIRRAGVDDWQTVREIRLRALQDAPDAFASTYQEEHDFADAVWIQRLSGDSVTFLAYHGGFGPSPIGICVGLPDGTDVTELVAMWVDPRLRGQGVATPLINAILEWAAARGARQVRLWVTETNDRAARCYLRNGFAFTGERTPLPSNPALPELRMAWTVPLT